MKDASFLMPGIPVSDGTLPTVEQHLGMVDGVPALLTNLQPTGWRYFDKLWLYTAVQKMEGPTPRVRFSKHEVQRTDVTVVNGCLAIVNEEFSDDMKGWALVHISDDNCSPQTIVTHCTLYQQYTTDKALQEAAKSYGGLTKRL